MRPRRSSAPSGVLHASLWAPTARTTMAVASMARAPHLRLLPARTLGTVQHARWGRWRQRREKLSLLVRPCGPGSMGPSAWRPCCSFPSPRSMEEGARQARPYSEDHLLKLDHDHRQFSSTKSGSGRLKHVIWRKLSKSFYSNKVDTYYSRTHHMLD
jgi:hypothetical protein